MLRALAVASSLLLPLVALFVGGSLPAYALPAVAGLAVVPVVVARTDSWFTAVLGGAMIAVATLVAPQAMSDLNSASQDSWPEYDLTQAGLPDEASGQVRVRGFLRTEWLLDEYAVQQGDRPNQNEDAAARLVPLIGTTGDELKLEGRVVVARVPGSGTLKITKQEYTGTLRPLEPSLLESLFATAAVPKQQLRGVLLDTMEVPDVARGWRSLIFAAFATLIGLGVLWTVTGPRDIEADAKKP